MAYWKFHNHWKKLKMAHWQNINISLENICHSFLVLHCRRMPWECKYWEIKWYGLHVNFLEVLGASQDLHITRGISFPNENQQILFNALLNESTGVILGDLKNEWISYILREIKRFRRKYSLKVLKINVIS